ncbi:MAG: hypothetical protein WCL50_01290 [Spirochaetota bacterium]
MGASVPIPDLRVVPSVSWPAWDTETLAIGGGAFLTSTFALPLPEIRIGPELGYALLPLREGYGDLTTVSTGVVAVLDFHPIPGLALSPAAHGGYFAATRQGSPGIGGSGYFGGGLAIAASMGPAWVLGLEGTYRNYYGLFQSLDLGLSARLDFHGGGPSFAPFLKMAPKVCWPVWDPEALDPGGGAELSSTFDLGGPEIRAGPGVGFAVLPIHSGAGTLSIASAGIEASIDLKPLPRLSLSPIVQGGYYLASRSGASGIGGSAYFGGGLTLSISIGTAWGLGPQGIYRNHQSLFQALDLGLTLRFAPIAETKQSRERGPSAAPLALSTPPATA